MSDTPVTLGTLLQDNTHLILDVQEIEGGGSIMFFKSRPQPRRGVGIPRNYDRGGRVDGSEWLVEVARWAWNQSNLSRRDSLK